MFLHLTDLKKNLKSTFLLVSYNHYFYGEKDQENSTKNLYLLHNLCNLCILTYVMSMRLPSMIDVPKI